MSSIKIYKEDNASNTVVSNKFIDEYMVDANDAQIKVYLYLLRMMSANLPTGISDMADKFNHTEKDIIRALKYWEKSHLLSLEFDESKNLTGIRFVNPTKDVVPEARPLAPIVPLKLVSSDQSVDFESVSKEAQTISYDEIPSYSLDLKKAFRENPDTCNIPFLAETYLGKNITPRNLDTLYFIHHELNFSEDLIDYLLQYCVDHGSKSFSYISKVACDWAQSGVNTVKKAKAHINSAFDKNVYAIMKELGRTGNPTEAEAELISKWYKEYGFELDVIFEACRRTVIATTNGRLRYCDSILTSWKTSGVRNLNDLTALDTSYKKARSGALAPTTGKNSFNSFSMTQDYDFDAIEKMILSK